MLKTKTESKERYRARHLEHTCQQKPSCRQEEYIIFFTDLKKKKKKFIW